MTCEVGQAVPCTGAHVEAEIQLEFCSLGCVCWLGAAGRKGHLHVTYTRGPPNEPVLLGTVAADHIVAFVNCTIVWFFFCCFFF